MLISGMFFQTASVAHASSSAVTVRLPAFKVTLNGTAIDNKTSQYPLITYKDITYFPMTYYDCRFLGLESVWNSSSGLNISKTGVSWDYHKYNAKSLNSSTYIATKSSFLIKVNEKSIDNSKEVYPLLLFRNVTYFPLTWRFAVEEFGWDYSFDKINGLVINSTKSGSAAGQLTLPIVTRENGEKGAFTMAGDYFYYEGSNGSIYQTPATNPTKKKKVYQLPEATGYGSIYVYSYLKTENGEALLSYHTGGATMGSDHLIWLKNDGTSKVLDSGYSLMKIYDDYTVRVEQRFPFNVENLQIRKNNEKEYKNVGNPDYSYGMYIYELGSGNNKSRSGRPSNDLHLINNDIYVLGYYGYYLEDNNAATTGIYRVNINSNEQVRLCNNEVTSFKIVDNIIYFTDKNNAIYKIDLSGGEAELLVDEAVNLYEVLEGKLYYSLKKQNNQLYIYGKEESLNPGGKVKSLEVQNGYMVAVFEKDSSSQYKMMIIDKAGKVIYKTIENVLLARIENGKVVFVKDN